MSRLVPGPSAPGGPAVLPHDGSMDWLTSYPVPNDDRFPLVGYANGRDATRANARLLDRLPGGCQRVAPYLFWIVLYPADTGIELLKLRLRCGNGPRFSIKYDASG